MQLIVIAGIIWLSLFIFGDLFMDQFNKTSYRVTNTTIKPQRIDRKTGVDLRSVQEQVGYKISWKDPKGESILLHQGRSRIISYLPEGLIIQHKAGDVHIKKLESGMLDEMLEHVNIEEKSKSKKENSKNSKDKADTEEAEKPKKAKAILMGESHSEESIKETGGYPGAVNPDGPNQHTVLAPSAETRRKQSTRKKS